MTGNLQQQAFHFYQISGAPYTKFPRVKKKKNGKKKIRWIYAPEEKLKQVQRTIMRSVLYRYASHPCAHAYVSQRNIRSGAHEHCGKEFTIVLDIKDFFPSITKEMIKKALSFYTEDLSEAQHHEFFAWDDRIRKAVANVGLPGNFSQGTTTLDVLCELCTYEGVIPQGAPTSGALSNIVLYPLDCLFEQTSIQHDIVYTRYADDLSFSGDDLDELKRIVFGYVFKKLQGAGFAINKKKVHVFKGDQRIITGLNIHTEGVRPSRKYRRKVRARLAGLRNRVSDCTTASGVCYELGKHKYLRGELGHYWYVLYTDTYTSPEKMAADYFIPIAFKIKEFFPSFLGIDKGALRKELQGASIAPTAKSEFVGCMMFLSSEIRKMCITDLVYEGEERNQKPRLLKKPLERIFRLEGLTHREKRALIRIELENVCRPDWVTWMTEGNLQNLYRLAGPEDKLSILLTVVHTKLGQRGIWYRVCMLGARHEYHERLALLRAIAHDEKFLVGIPSEKFALRKAVRKIMRGLSLDDLIEFVTCQHENVRVAAQDLIAYKNQRAGISESDD